MSAMGMEETLFDSGRRTTIPSYAPSLILSKGGGARVWDSTGKEYLDFLAGIAVNVLGHCHPVYVKRVQEQMGTLLQVSNMFFSEPQLKLQLELTRRSFADRVYFCNSGAEANEAALKLARRYQRAVRGEDRYEIISAERSFHGRTFGAITATGQPKYHAGFEPLVPGFSYASFNDLASVEALITERTAAIIVEPIQGEGGVVPATPEFIRGIRSLCDQHGIVMILDEVQTGIGRTGRLFAYEHYGIEPDVVSLAKGLGGGLPVGAMLCREEISHGFVPGSHATTFGGNPVVTAGGLAVLEVLDSEALLDAAVERGAQLAEGLGTLANQFPRLGQVRGKGLMLAVEFDGDLKAMVGASREAGLLHNSAGGTVLRFLPPLTITKTEIAEGLNRFESALLRNS